MTLAPGGLFPDDLGVLDPSGDRHPLAAVLGDEAGLLIYLRHLG